MRVFQIKSNQIKSIKENFSYRNSVIIIITCLCASLNRINAVVDDLQPALTLLNPKNNGQVGSLCAILSIYFVEHNRMSCFTAFN